MDDDQGLDLTCSEFKGHGHCSNVRVDFTGLAFAQTQSISNKWIVCLTSYSIKYHVIDLFSKVWMFGGGEFILLLNTRSYISAKGW